MGVGAGAGETVSGFLRSACQDDGQPDHIPRTCPGTGFGILRTGTCDEVENSVGNSVYGDVEASNRKTK